MAGTKCGPGAGCVGSGVGAPERSWLVPLGVVLAVGAAWALESDLGSEWVLTTSFENKVTYVYLF